MFEMWVIKRLAYVEDIQPYFYMEVSTINKRKLLMNEIIFEFIFFPL
jgi:hypothetical protein